MNLTDKICACLFVALLLYFMVCMWCYSRGQQNSFSVSCPISAGHYVRVFEAQRACPLDRPIRPVV